MAKEFESKALQAINQGIMDEREKMKGHVPVVLENMEKMDRDLRMIEDWMAIDVGFSKAQQESISQARERLQDYRVWLNTILLSRLKN